MLRVGLTGGLGSGKSTAAKLFAALGAHILSADEIARALMQPGQQVYREIVATFGSSVVQLNGELDRVALARIAFAEGRIEALNAIVHPATIARQAELAEVVFTNYPEAIVIVESALIFETKYGETKYGETEHRETKSSKVQPDHPASSERHGWRQRFDKLILVTAPEAARISRFIARSSSGRSLSELERTGLEAEANRRIAQQWSDERKALLSDYILTNAGAVTELEWQVDQLWPMLVATSHESRP